MFSAALIVFRESLEAALFVGIVAAATRGLAGRSRWLRTCALLLHSATTTPCAVFSLNSPKKP
jgi:high-affinity Fe2+/Pb2+ permease